MTLVFGVAVLPAILGAAVAARAADTPQLSELLLFNWEADRCWMTDQMSIEGVDDKSPQGDAITRIRMRSGDNQGVLTEVNLPPTAQELKVFSRGTSATLATRQAIFADAHGWGGKAEAMRSSKESKVGTASLAKMHWTWRVGFFKSKVAAPLRFRGFKLGGGKEPGDIVWEAGPVRVSYVPDESQWLYVDMQPKTVASRSGVLPPLVLRVANLGVQARTFRLSVQAVERNGIAAPGKLIDLGPIALAAGELREIAVPRPPLGLLGRYVLEYRAETKGAEAVSTRETVSVVNGLDQAEGFRDWAARRQWFSKPDRRAATGPDGKVEIKVVATADNAISPLPLFPTQRRVPFTPAPLKASLAEAPGAERALSVLSSQLSPAWLVRSSSNELRLFGNTARVGLGGPSHVAFATAAGSRVLKAGDTLDAKELQAMSQPWLLVWWQGSKNWNEWDAPHLVVLQHHPAALVLDDAGLVVKYRSEADHLAVMPLYGYAKLPQQGANRSQCRFPADWPAEWLRTWTWEASLPAAVIERCDWWSRALVRFPYDVKETFTLNHQTGAIDVRDRFQYIDLATDWKTPGLTLAPLSPTLAVAMRSGYPLSVDGKLTDCRYPTMFGPYCALENVDELTYHMAIGPFLMQTDEANITAPKDTSTPARLAQAQLLAAATADSVDEDVHAWDYRDPNFVWQMQGSDMREPASLTAYARGTVRHDRKSWLLARALYLLLDTTRYKMDERAGTLSRRYIDGPGIGNWKAGDWGDSGKLGTDMVYNAYVYAFNTGDYQTIADRWDVVTSLASLPQTMSWATVGRWQIAEMGDEGPTMLALARLAYAVGDKETYTAAAYWYARELVHHTVKDGGLTQWLDDFKPWHQDMNLATETGTNVWGDNAGWMGGGFRPERKGDNQWHNFYVRFDDFDVLRFHRKYAHELPRRVAAVASPEDSQNNRQLYFIRVGILGEDPGRALALAQFKKPLTNYSARRMTAAHEFTPTMKTLIPDTLPAFSDDGWAWDQMNTAWVGLINSPGISKGRLPTLKWFWWKSPAPVPNDSDSNRWTFGTVGPTGQMGGQVDTLKVTDVSDLILVTPPPIESKAANGSGAAPAGE